MKRFKNILFVADSDMKGSDAFKQAISLAENNQAQLTMVSILEEFPSKSRQKIQDRPIRDLQNSILEKRQHQLEAMVKSIDSKRPINTKVLTGTAFLTLIREVLSNKFDLLIKSVQKEGILDRLFGSSDMHLLRKCPCPVWLIKSSQQGHYRKIMAAVDFDSPEDKSENDVINRQIIEMSKALALSDFSELHIIHVWRAYGESSMRSGIVHQPEAYIKDYVDRIHTKHKHLLDKLVSEIIDKDEQEVADYLKPKIHLIKGFARDMIPEVVKEQQIDLIIMGTVGRTGIPGFLMGNTAETVLNQIDCSVLAVKPEGFITPVELEE